MKKGLITRANGNISIVHPSPEALAKGKTIEELVERLLHEGDTYTIIEETSIPKDRYFRNAWKPLKKGKSISIDKTKAADIKMEHIRKSRNKELIEQDVIFSQQQEKLTLSQIQIETIDEDLARLEYEKSLGTTPESRKTAIDFEMNNLATNKSRLNQETRLIKGELSKIAEKKQKLRDLPQRTDLKNMTLERMKHYVPSELAHRDDVE
jgi:hypothetical protein